MPTSLSAFFVRPDAHPIALALALSSLYGKDWIMWEPETLWTMLDKAGAQPSAHTRAKIQAVRTMLGGTWFFDRWEVFQLCCQAINNNLPDFQICRPASLPQLFHAVWAAEQICPQNDYGDEVRRWIAACALNEGVVFLPPPLDFAQKEASRIEYRCRKCGNIDPDENTPHCDWCGAPPEFLERKPKYVDPDFIRPMWDLVKDKASSTVELDEDLVGIHLARLLVARDYLDSRRGLAENQVRELGLWK